MSKPLRVLIVEDSEDDTALLLLDLRRGGFDPVHARVEDAAALRTALRNDPWDIVLSDHDMPRFDSFKALEIVRKERPDIPFIVISGKAGEDFAVKAMKSGANDYLLKARLTRLVPAIEREIQEAESRRQRKRAEEALHESDQRFRAIFNQAAVGIGLMTPGGRFLSVNQKLCDVLRRNEEELLSLRFEDITYPDDYKVCVAQIIRLMADEITSFTTKLRYSPVEGVKLWGKLTLSIIRTPGADRVTLLGIVEDVSEAERLEEQLRQAQKMEAVGQLAGGVAHDFNNLLAVIQSGAELLASRPGSDAFLTETLLNATKRGAELTQRLLAFSRRQSLTPQVIDVGELVSDMSRMLTRTLGAAIEIKIVAATRLWLLWPIRDRWRTRC